MLGKVTWRRPNLNNFKERLTQKEEASVVLVARRRNSTKKLGKGDL